MIATEDVVTITQNIFNTMLEMEADPVPLDCSDERDSEMVGCIQIVGEWCGTVLLKTPVALASTAGSRMLMINEDDVVDADRQDALAELTNMIGGNIKSILPSPSSLSLPTVTNGRDFAMRTFGAKPISQAAFQCEQHVFRVVVLEKTI
jgi:chemotaxis protein CheX